MRLVDVIIKETLVFRELLALIYQLEPRFTRAKNLGSILDYLGSILAENV